MRKNQTKQANGEGSVYKMKDGRFGAAISLGKDATGKRLRHVVTGKTEQEVIDKMKLWLAQNGQLDPQTVVINGQSTVEELIEDYIVNGLKERNNRDVTIDNYANVLVIFQNFFSGKRLWQINSREINRFFVWMVNDVVDGNYHYGSVTVERLKGLLNRMFKRAVRNGYLMENPVDGEVLKSIVAQKEQKHKPLDALEDEELEIILVYCTVDI